MKANETEKTPQKRLWKVFINLGVLALIGVLFAVTFRTPGSVQEGYMPSSYATALSLLPNCISPFSIRTYR